MTYIYAQRVTLVILLGLFLSPLNLNAGDYHNSTANGGPVDTLACSQCHTMHNSQGGQTMIYESDPNFGSEITTPKLLRAQNILNLCLHCHGNKAASPQTAIDGTRRIPPRVWDTRSIFPDTGDYTPSAGDFMDRTVNNEANRHSLGMDVSSFEPPGYTANDWSGITGSFSTTFNCLYCHAQHGNENYRNLRYDPGTRAGDIKGNASRARIPYATKVKAVNPTECSDGTAFPCDVYVLNPSGLDADGDNREKYFRSNVTFGVSTADGDGINGISTFCGKCHNNFYGISGSALGGVGAAGVGDGDTGAAPWVRHPVGDVTFAQSDITGNAHIDVANITNNLVGNVTLTRFADGEWLPGGYTTLGPTTGTEQPFCLSCHYAHGGGNSNGATDSTLDHSNLVFTDEKGDVNLEPTYNNSEHYMRNTCNQCHNQ